MKSNERLIGNTSYKRKFVNLAEAFMIWKYLSLQAELSFEDQKIDIDTVRNFHFHKSENATAVTLEY